MLSIKGFWWAKLKTVVTLVKIFPKHSHNNHLFTKFSKTLTMVAPTGHVDPSNTTTEDATSQTSMKIQSSNFHVKLDVSKYPEELQMLIVALNHYVLSMVMSCLFSVPMTLLSLVGSTLAFNKITKVVMFQLTNEKKYKLT